MKTIVVLEAQDLGELYDQGLTLTLANGEKIIIKAEENEKVSKTTDGHEPDKQPRTQASTNGKTFWCPQKNCVKKFKFKAWLNNHLSDAHGVTDPL